MSLTLTVENLNKIAQYSRDTVPWYLREAQEYIFLYQIDDGKVTKQIISDALLRDRPHRNRFWSEAME